MRPSFIRCDERNERSHIGPAIIRKNETVFRMRSTMRLHSKHGFTNGVSPIFVRKRLSSLGEGVAVGVLAGIGDSGGLAGDGQLLVGRDDADGDSNRLSLSFPPFIHIFARGLIIFFPETLAIISRILESDSKSNFGNT